MKSLLATAKNVTQRLAEGHVELLELVGERTTTCPAEYRFLSELCGLRKALARRAAPDAVAPAPLAETSSYILHEAETEAPW